MNDQKAFLCMVNQSNLKSNSISNLNHNPNPN